MDHRELASGKTQPPDAVKQIPEDERNTAPEVRARYRYQDECAALTILRHLSSDDLEGVLVEHSTDLILVPSGGTPELVSIKHRESNQYQTNAWSWNALRRQRVLSDLYRAWVSTDRRSTVAFWTNSGFTGKAAYRLWQVCALGKEPTGDLLVAVSREVQTDRTDSVAFLTALTIPENPLPRRKEITDIGVRRTAELLRKYRSSTSEPYADACYRELLRMIAAAGTDAPDSEADPSPSIAATLDQVLSSRVNTRLMQKYLPAGHILKNLLRIFDQQSAASLPDAGQQGWEPDAHFTGRSRYMQELYRHMAPGEVTETAPVVVHGIPGCGKTSLAAQFGAQHKNIFRTILINGSKRTTLTRDLAALAGHPDTTAWDMGIAQMNGPVTPVLPGNSATLLIVDGVTDPNTIRGIIPRRSLCRVIITSTAAHLDQAYVHIELQCWSRQESRNFIERAYPSTSLKDGENLAAALSDHPLAITQAINYCHVTGRLVDDYLARLALEPVRALDLGQASGHLNSVVKTITMSIEAAEERCPDSSYLLSLLSYLGNDPIDEVLFDGGVGIGFVSAPTYATPDREQRTWLKSIFGRSQQGTEETPTYSTTVIAQRVFDRFQDRDWYDSAVETLLMSSLTTRRGRGLVVHPLIARVVRELSKDPRPWLEIGFGLFTEFTQEGVQKDFTNLDPHLDQISTLASTALKEQLGGPAVFFACYVLARRVGVTAGDGSEGDRGSVAIEFGQAAAELAQQLARGRPSDISMLVAAQRALAQALTAAKQPNEAMIQLRKALELCRLYNQEDLSIGTLVDIATVAADVPDRGVAENVLLELNEYGQEHNLDDKGQMFAAYAKSRLLRRLGRTDEAAAILGEVMKTAEYAAMKPALQAEIYDIATMVARDQNEGISAFEHAMAALILRRQNIGDTPDSQFIDALASTADAAIDAWRLAEARELIEEAEELTRTTFGPDNFSYGHVLAIRGRLKLMISGPEDALQDLEVGLNLMRPRSEADPACLPAPLYHIAQAALFLGDMEKARRSIEEAYTIDCAVYGRDHPETMKDRDLMRWVGVSDPQ